LETGSRATFRPHCLFTQTESARHAVRARVVVEEDAELIYREAHYHGTSGGIEVIPRTSVRLGPRACYLADFAPVQGRVGHLAIDYDVDVGAGALAELTSRVHGNAGDRVRIREVVRLDGERAQVSALPQVRHTPLGEGDPRGRHRQRGSSPARDPDVPRRRPRGGRGHHRAGDAAVILARSPSKPSQR
jgi:hypothetical protein